MPAVGFLAILIGAFLLREVFTGRVRNTGTDAKDIFLAAIGGNPNAIGDVFARRGTNVDVGGTDSVESPTGDAVSPTPTLATDPYSGASSFVGTVESLGNSAQGYRLGASGPSYYDCSGLIWRAMYSLGIYKGSRFTTSTFERIAGKFATKVDSPAIGDIVLWPTHHMGVCVGQDQMYSARDRVKGIGLSSISGDSSYFKSQPQYWRING